MVFLAKGNEKVTRVAIKKKCFYYIYKTCINELTRQQFLTVVYILR